MRSLELCHPDCEVESHLTLAGGAVLSLGAPCSSWLDTEFLAQRETGYGARPGHTRYNVELAASCFVQCVFFHVSHPPPAPGYLHKTCWVPFILRFPSMCGLLHGVQVGKDFQSFSSNWIFFLLCSETGSGITQGSLKLSNMVKDVLKFPSAPPPPCLLSAGWQEQTSKPGVCSANNGNQGSQHPRQAVYKLSLKYSPWILSYVRLDASLPILSVPHTMLLSHTWPSRGS